MTPREKNSQATVASSSELKNYFKIILGIQFFAWAVGIYALWHRQTLFVEGATTPTFCNINSIFNCDAVALSRYSQILGIPTAAHAMVFHSLLAIMAVLGFMSVQEHSSRKIRLYGDLVFYFSILGMIPTLYQALLSFFVVKALCLMCIIAYLANLAAFIVAIIMKKHLPKVDNYFFTKEIGTIPSGMFITVGVLVALQYITPFVMARSLAAGAPDYDDNYMRLMKEGHAQNKVFTFNTDGLPAYGATKETAKLTVVEFSDFQCPFCARSAATLPSLFKQYENSVRVVFRNYPLDSSCNSNMKGAMHPLACRAAKIGICVFKNRGDVPFFSYKKEVFAKQSLMTSESLVQDAMAQGMDRKAIESCIEDTAINDALQKDINEATAANVQGTPSIFLNGRLFDKGPQPILLEEILKTYL